MRVSRKQKADLTNYQPTPNNSRIFNTKKSQFQNSFESAFAKCN